MPQWRDLGGSVGEERQTCAQPVDSRAGAAKSPVLPAPGSSHHLENTGAFIAGLVTTAGGEAEHQRREQLLRQRRQSWQRGEDYETFAKNEYRLKASNDLTGENATTP
ncbi:MAG: hypothetical protein AVDCRST_MAG77-2223 [uncultured Chloroflexi bacterium]|uniref:Uncharacterized protein n=1 Tax=uncultured Chloroflexota bacterium TaxID=166587 RepID=A0A6J4IIE8_9CHLR|nr:MAG: hypothetical protein AVDCRST_MAG77-2223 [uncultured Chloroflexota bacterium]